MSHSTDIDLSILQNMPSKNPRKWRFLEETDSTNAEIARALLDSPNEEGLIVIADSQTGGKGRLGRVWHSEPGMGIYFSTLIRPNLPPEKMPLITLMAGLATLNAVNEFTPQPALLKWPNDLLLNGKKIAGILCENHSTERPAVIIGIGINVNHSQFPPEIKNIASSLKLESGRNIDRTSLIKHLVTQLDLQYEELQNNRVENIIRNWSLNTDLFGKTITLKKGKQSISGIALRLDALGRLVIVNESGEETAFDSGEVSLGY
ncbi:MAG: biotin--[acetyl-CoA-carboxylase] ligase [Nitrospinota bacterium]